MSHAIFSGARAQRVVGGRRSFGSQDAVRSALWKCATQFRSLRLVLVLGLCMMLWGCGNGDFLADMVVIFPDHLSAATVQQPFSATFSCQAHNGNLCVFSISMGALPDGLHLTNDTDNKGNPIGTATLSGIPTKAGQFTFDVFAQGLQAGVQNAAPYTMTVNQPALSVTGYPSPVAAGTSNAFMVTAVDSSGAAVKGYTGTVKFSSSDVQAAFSLASYTFVAADNGTHSFSATLKTSGTQSIAATDANTSAITGTQAGIQVNPGPAASLSVAGYPSPVAAGTSNNFTVTARDGFANVAVSYRGAVTLSSSDTLALLPVTTYTFVAADNGVHTLGATFNTVGTQSLTATDTTTSSIKGTQSGILVSNAAPSPVLSITKTHTGNFAPGQQGATYTVTVSNGASAGPTAGTVTVTETVPSGLTLVSMAGTGWTCPGSTGANTCDRNDPLPAGASYPPITITVNVAPSAASPQVNQVTVSGGGSAPANASDSTNVAFAQSSILTPGFNVAIDEAGDTIVAADGTEAFLFVLSGGAWHEVAQLNDPDGLPGQAGAVSAAISGDGNSVVIGSCGNSVCKGHGFVYVAPAGGWITLVNPNNTITQMNPTTTLTASGAIAGDRVGLSVAIATGTPTVVGGSPVNVVAVSAPNDLTQGCCGGHVYVFVEPAGGWALKGNNLTLGNEDAVITSPPSGGNENFGTSISIDSAGDTIAVGATSFLNSDRGTAYVFEPSGGWVNTSTAAGVLTPGDGVGGNLGRSIAISGDGKTVIAGAPLNPVSGNTSGPGAAYVFTKPNSGWAPNTENAKLTAADGQNTDFFGSAVAISGDGSTVVVGADNHGFTAPNTLGPGAVYVFPRLGAAWSNPAPSSQEVAASAGTDIHGNSITPNIRFGIAVAMSGNSGTIVVGGLVTGVPGGQAVFVF